MNAEMQRLVTQPVKGTPKGMKKMVERIKMAAMTTLGDNKVLNKTPSIEHPLMPLDEEIDQNLSEAAVLSDMMKECLEKLEELDPNAPELMDELVQKIADK